MSRTGNQYDLLADLYEQYYVPLLRTCEAIVGHNVNYQSMIEDCVQDVFVTAILKRDALQNHPNLIGWLKRACYHRMMHEIDRRVVRSKHSAFSMDNPGSPPIQDAADALNAWAASTDREVFQRALELLLSERERVVFEKMFVKGQTPEQIARQHRASLSSVKGTIHRIREKARRLKDIYFFFVL